MHMGVLSGPTATIPAVYPRGYVSTESATPPAAAPGGRGGRCSMLIVAVLAGAGIGLSLGALGSGGSILAVPVLVYLLGQSPLQATTVDTDTDGVSGQEISTSSTP